MSDNTKIEWTDATWNPITGCAVVSPGCTNCYAMKLAGTRLKNHRSREGLTVETKSGPVWNGKVRLNAEWMEQPLRWSRPRMIFVCAHGDLFAEGVPDEWIDMVFAVMASAPQHTFQVLTKRPERMRDYLFARRHLPFPNIWLGTSAEDQPRYSARWPFMEDIAERGWMVWVSAEPLLGPLDLLATPLRKVGPDGKAHLARPPMWVVAGGESGPGARPMHPEWIRALRDQCQIHGIPFLFKQWGAWKPVPWKLERTETETDAEYIERSEKECSTHALSRTGYLIELDHKPWSWARVLPQPDTHHAVKLVGKKVAGRVLDGVEHNAFPEGRA